MYSSLCNFRDWCAVSDSAIIFRITVEGLQCRQEEGSKTVWTQNRQNIMAHIWQ